jgi:hypothetical protein
MRKPPIPARIGVATAAVLGPELGELVYVILEGSKRGTVQTQPGRLLLQRLLPDSRPVQLDLPRIHASEDLQEWQDKVVDAMNAGRISPSEARTLQELGSRAMELRVEVERLQMHAADRHRWRW